MKGDVLEVSSKYNDGKVGSKVYKFTDEGFTVVSISLKLISCFGNNYLLF